MIVAGLGVAEAAELEDAALAAMERKPFDFAAARERRGLHSAETFDSRFREALAERNKLHKQNPRTDPGRRQRPKRVWQGGINGMD